MNSFAAIILDNPVDESLNRQIKDELFLDFNLANSSDVEAIIKNT